MFQSSIEGHTQVLSEYSTCVLGDLDWEKL